MKAVRTENVSTLVLMCLVFFYSKKCDLDLISKTGKRLLCVDEMRSGMDSTSPEAWHVGGAQ